MWSDTYGQIRSSTMTTKRKRMKETTNNRYNHWSILSDKRQQKKLKQFRMASLLNHQAWRLTHNDPPK